MMMSHIHVQNFNSVCCPRPELYTVNHKIPMGNLSNEMTVVSGICLNVNVVLGFGKTGRKRNLKFHFSIPQQYYKTL